jgi:hypothetical protein
MMFCWTSQAVPRLTTNRSSSSTMRPSTRMWPQALMTISANRALGPFDAAVGAGPLSRRGSA